MAHPPSAAARILVVPASRDGLGPFYQDIIAVNLLEPWDARLEAPDRRPAATALVTFGPHG
jgi:hypothetical protein